MSHHSADLSDDGRPGANALHLQRNVAPPQPRQVAADALRRIVAQHQRLEAQRRARLYQDDAQQAVEVYGGLRLRVGRCAHTAFARPSAAGQHPLEQHCQVALR